MINDEGITANLDFKQMFCRETKLPQTTDDSGNKIYNPLDVVIATNFHFAIVLDLEAGPTVVLDHIFGQETMASTHALVAAASKAAAASTDAGSATPGAKGATVANMKKTVGPLSISNIGIKMQDFHLMILLDASLKLGPIELDLAGFGLGINLGANGALLLATGPADRARACGGV
jgi:hypothetical protein